jgi:arylsulfatase A-like enzyme
MCPPHYPVVPAAEFAGRSGGLDVAGQGLQGQADPGRYPDWLYQGDAMLGEIMRVLESCGLADNTLLIATSDNGAEHRVYAPLRESKRSIYEGGHRVPFVVRWPGRVRAGATWDHPICLNDLLATAAELSGAVVPANAGEDSVSLVSALLEKRSVGTRDGIIHQSMAADLAIRQGPWKLILRKNGVRELYQLEQDLSETRDLARDNPAMVEQLTTLLRGYINAGRSTSGIPQANDAVIPVEGTARGRTERKARARGSQQD